MENKKGVTMSIMLIAVAMMALLAGSAIIYGTNSINTANKNKFDSTLEIVQENAELYYSKNSKYPLAVENGSAIMVSTASLDADLKNEIANNGDVCEFFSVLDLTKMKLPSIEVGNVAANLKNGVTYEKQLENRDVFLINEDTGNVYYMAGLRYRGKRVYSNSK